MNLKTTLFLLLGMSLSFLLVLAVMTAVFIPSSPSPRHQSPQAQFAPSPAAQSEALAQPVPSPPPSLLTPALPPAAPDQFKGLKKELAQQLVQLRQDRNRLLSSLSVKLAALAPAEAADQLRLLDDETAALVLQPLSSTQRRAILQHLDPGRVPALNRRLQARPTLPEG